MVVVAVLVALFSAAMWFAWLGWDHAYYFDDRGYAHGPYRAWQVVGCALSIGVGAVVAFLRAPRALAITAIAVAADGGFAVPWAVDASRDETGLWAVGLVLLVAGGCVALGAVLAVTHLLHGPGGSPGHALAACSLLALLAFLVYAPAAVVPLVAGGWVFFFRWLPERRQPGNGLAH